MRRSYCHVVRGAERRDGCGRRPGKPALYKVPERVMATNGTEDSVAFGWSEVTFDAGASTKYYILKAVNSFGNGVQTTVSATGDPSNDATALLPLVNSRSGSGEIRCADSGRCRLGRHRR